MCYHFSTEKACANNLSLLPLTLLSLSHDSTIPDKGGEAQSSLEVKCVFIDADVSAALLCCSFVLFDG